MSEEINMSKEIELESLSTLPGAAAIKEQARKTNVSTALSHAFTDARICINIQGEIGNWVNTGIPTFFIGDHRSGLERLPLIATLGRFGRDDVRFIALPQAFE